MPAHRFHPFRILMALLALSCSLATGQEAKNTPSQEQAKGGGLGGFLNGLNEKSKALKDATDRAAGQTSTTPTNKGTSAQVGPETCPRSAAPIFDNDSAATTTDERIQEVLSRSFEWGDAGANTSGYKKINTAPLGPLSGFGPLPWKASKSQCVAALAERGAAEPAVVKAGPGLEVVNALGGTFAGQSVAAWQLSFFNDQLFEARVEYVYQKGNVLREYRRMSKSLVAKYGKWSGEQDLRFLYLDLDVDYASKKRNARDDEEKHWFYLMRLDAQYAQALAGQSAQPMARWIFDNDDTLTFWISARSKMMLQYRNSGLADEAARQAKKVSSPEKDL